MRATLSISISWSQVKFDSAYTVGDLVVEPTEESCADEARDGVKDRKKDKRFDRTSGMPMDKRHEREKHSEDRCRNRINHRDHLRSLENLERLDFMHREYSFLRFAQRIDYIQLSRIRLARSTTCSG